MKNTAADLTELIQQILPILQGYLDQSMKGEVPVLRQDLASDVAGQMGLASWVQKGGIDATSASSLLIPYLDNSQRMHHPHYIGHQVSSSHLISAVADFIHGAINNPMAIYEMGPSGAVIEQAMINWMLSKAGWFLGDSIEDFRRIDGNGAGVMTHGGSMANLTALLAARARIAPDAWQDGTPNDLVVMGSEAAHYSIARAIAIIGMGHKHMLGVPCNDIEVLRPECLEATYKTAIDDGKRVMAVVANACATSTGLYDPIDEVGHWCQEHGIWYHVDGAHGASALVSDTEKKWLSGLERADSMIWDTHKMLRTSTLAAAVLFRNQDDLASTFRQKGSYLFHDKEKPGFDLMPYTIECTKAGIGTKLFWVLASEGESGIARYIDRQYQITRTFYDLIHSTVDFEVPYYPQANILCFRYIAGDPSNEYQLTIRNQLVSEGEYYITSTEVRGIRYLRLTVINELTDTHHIMSLLEALRKIGQRLASAS